MVLTTLTSTALPNKNINNNNSNIQQNPTTSSLTSTFSPTSSLAVTVFEWVDGQDICFEITRRAAAGFIYSEAVASHYTRQLVQAVQHMHSQNILHRGYKASQFITGKNNAPLKIHGLGVAFRLSDDNKCPTGEYLII
uniref:Protein kinase domain-containing protein n=1 Tax=Meloidogyne hapla TaxID=6305 RepID=A0A1I8C0K4_MELHA